MIASDTDNRRIITIDDNEDIHNDFRAILARSPNEDGLSALEEDLFGRAEEKPDEGFAFDHESATQGSDGVKKIEAALAEGRPFALAFVDMRMPPGWDGLETIRQIWAVDSRVQIVICTAYSDYSADEITGRFRSSDSLLILKKPFDQLEVIQLANALTQKWLLARQAAMRMTELRTLVAQRTSELEDTNTRLVEEMARRRKAEDELRAVSRTDALTGIYNRRAFDQYLQHIWHDAPETAPLSLLLIDIDNFKAYNDRYGHVAGDECLQLVAKKIASSTTRAADFFARYGGEEFALVLPDTDAAGARHVANRVLESVRSAQIGHDSSPVAPIVTVSVGCATLSSPNQGDAQLLTQKADESLYRAKRNGKNGVGVVP